MQHFRPLLQKYELSEQQWRVLRSLYPDDVVEATELAHRAAILPSSLTRILKALEERKLVATTRHVQDGRRLQISLSPAGKGLIKSALPESKAIYARIYGALGQERVNTLGPLLREVLQICENLPVESAN